MCVNGLASHAWGLVLGRDEPPGPIRWAVGRYYGCSMRQRGVFKAPLHCVEISCSDAQSQPSPWLSCWSTHWLFVTTQRPDPVMFRQRSWGSGNLVSKE
jgi:hypothetical protein